MQHRLLLGVNIDHIATLRQARGESYPDPVHAALLAEQSGADGITLHLREDRRHIQEHDVRRMRPLLATRMNLEMALTPWMLEFALEIRPEFVCLVPEKREELTTEGGLDVAADVAGIRSACERLRAAGIQVSLFVDPEQHQLDAALRTGAAAVELHTGAYAKKPEVAQLQRLRAAIDHVDGRMIVNAGHGLHYHNVEPVAALAGLHELNIGHAIMARALFTGLAEAVASMKKLMREAVQLA
ncbi:MAG: pyridoxine 5'-phosphate synthase [Pseudomonadales bacterium]|nr:pyridoxine 5'-phosphate synthase [Pseudomonadales bacterium]